MKFFNAILIYILGINLVTSLPALPNLESTENDLNAIREEIKELKRTTRQCPFSTFLGGAGGGFPFGGIPFGDPNAGGAPNISALVNMAQIALNVLTQLQAGQNGQGQGNNGFLPPINNNA